MLVGKVKSIIDALEVDNVIQGFPTLEIIQEVVNDIFADDLLARLYPYPPYVTTIDAKTTYTFDELFGVGAGQTWRKVRGLFQPGLSSLLSGAYTTDIGQFNQTDVSDRVYDYDVNVNNETRIVQFKSNPGLSTEKWKVDYWPNAPLLTELDTVPIVSGWELKLLIPGCRAYYEQLDKGPGIQTQMFQALKTQYRTVVESNKNLKNNSEDLGLRLYNSRIKNTSAF